MHLRKVGIVGTGSYVPEDKITNADLEKIVDTSNEWIVTRTGIAERRRARPDQASSDLGYEASVNALEAAGLSADDVDVIICATITPDMNFPTTACFVQKKLKALNASAYDLAAACSGFIYALREGRALIASGEAETVLVVAAETLTKYTDYEDRASCILFGDAAGAVVLRPTDGPREIIHTFAGADGYTDAAMSMVLRNGGSQSPFTPEALARKEHKMVVRGREVYKFAVTKMAELIGDAAKRLNIPVADIDWIIAHQANLRILQGVAERLGCPEERFFINVDKYGNTSAASLGLALDEAVRGGRIKDGQNVVLCAFGGGVTWASAIIKW
jgi:3-oxoacyl-[acyl-carrier-protein] synthase-3